MTMTSWGNGRHQWGGFPEVALLCHMWTAWAVMLTEESDGTTWTIAFPWLSLTRVWLQLQALVLASKTASHPSLKRLHIVSNYGQPAPRPRAGAARPRRTQTPRPAQGGR